MASTSKNKRLAKTLLRYSLNEDGLIEEGKAVESIDGLKELGLSSTKDILRHFLTEVKNHLRLYEAKIEIGCENYHEVEQTLRDKIGSLSGRKIELSITSNEALLAGYRIRIGDDVYEDSVASRLENLRKSFL